MRGKKKDKSVLLKGIHPSLRKMSKDHPIHYLKVMDWIAHNQFLVSEYRKQERQKVTSSIANRASCEGYIKHMRHYLKHGDWIDSFYGKDQEGKVIWISRT